MSTCTLGRLVSCIYLHQNPRASDRLNRLYRHATLSLENACIMLSPTKVACTYLQTPNTMVLFTCRICLPKESSANVGLVSLDSSRYTSCLEAWSDFIALPRLLCAWLDTCHAHSHEMLQACIVSTKCYRPDRFF